MFSSPKIARGAGFSGGAADVIEVLGAETNIYVDLPGSLRCIVREFNDLPVTPGQEISLGVIGEKVHLFDAETGESITGRAHREASVSGDRGAQPGIASVVEDILRGGGEDE